MSMFEWICPTCNTVVSTFESAPPTCGCGAIMEPPYNEPAEPSETKSQAGAAQAGWNYVNYSGRSYSWFALAKAICVDPFDDAYDDAYWERERRYFEERDDRMFKNGNDSKEGETE